MIPKCKRYIKKCGDFSICSEIGDEGLLFTEYAEERFTLYQIVIKGSGRISKVFEDDSTEGNANGNNFINLKKYLGHDTIFKSNESFHIFGFNTLDVNVNWDGRLIKESFYCDISDSYLICFDGNPIINGKEVQRLDYAKLEKKRYDVELNDAIVGVFSRL
tara:strand:- start:1187 stop:1669 length:483 start_codon:yes stop_codon:yes gene_type:complete